MAKQSIDERISKETKKLNQAKARLQALKAKQQAQARKEATRTKILLGAWLLHEWESLAEPAIQQQLNAIDAYLTRDKDKVLVPKTVRELLSSNKKA